MLKNIIKIVISVIGSLIIIFIIFSIFLNYSWSKTGKIVNGEKFCTNKQYSIGKMLGGDDLTFFCDNEVRGKCINGIESYKLGKNNNLYLLFNLPEFIGKTENEVNDILKVDTPKGRIYSIFQNDYTNKYYAKSYDEVIRFLKLNYNDCSIIFYSNNDLEKLDKEEKMIFNEL